MSHSKHAVLSLGLGALIAARAVYAQEIPSNCAQADERFSEQIEFGRSQMRGAIKRSGTPAMSIAIGVEGSIVWSEAFGYADLEHAVQATPTTKFGIGSISKSLTMAAAAAFAEAGKLDLDAPVERYLPSFAHSGEGITTRLIAGHLSGLDDSFSTANRTTQTYFATTADALKFIEQEPLRHEPGTAHFYATGSYTIIAGVLEAVSGESYESLMRERVIEPAGMTDTQLNERSEIIPNRTRFYVKDDDGLVVNEPYFDPSFKRAGAGYLSTPTDLVRFAHALLGDELLDKALVEELFTPLKTSEGEDTGFGLGFRIETEQDWGQVIHQPGGGVGISCWLFILPEHDLVCAITTNLTVAPAGGREVWAIINAFIDQEK